MRLVPRSARWLAVPLLVTGLVTAAGAAPAHAHHTLRHAAGDDMHVGVAVTTELLNDPHYAPIIAAQFSSLTPAHEMQWGTVQPSQGLFNFGPGDQIANSAQLHDQHVYGQPLIWHQQAPGWLPNLSGAALDVAMQDHLTTVLQRWSGAVETWEVAKDVLAEDGSLRQSFWLDGLGPGYIGDAFRYARQAEPAATLCLDDHDTYALSHVKSDAYFQLAQDLLAQGVPIDCAGFQIDLELGELPGTQLRQNLQRFASLGLDIWITDLEIRTTTPPSQQELQQQAQEYAQVFETCRSMPACQGITLWGLVDQSWVPGWPPGPGGPPLWDEQLLPAPAYYTVLQQLTGPQQRAH